jgi:uncharacterized protein YndB with AHSA1/START domain
MNESTTRPASVRKELVVDVDPRRAFEVFTSEFGQWWPLLSHHIGRASPDVAIIEPFVDGRWFERAMDGSECDWGRVLVWDPPRRLVLTWCIDGRWQFDESLKTEVHVHFIAEGAQHTRVVLEHRHLDRYGVDADKMRGIFDSDEGWARVLQRFTAHAHGHGIEAPARPSPEQPNSLGEK